MHVCDLFEYLGLVFFFATILRAPCPAAANVSHRPGVVPGAWRDGLYASLPLITANVLLTGTKQVLQQSKNQLRAIFAFES